MLVSQILKSKSDDGVVTLPPGTVVSRVAEVLSARRIGAVVTSPDGKKLVGIVSERDIVREVGRRGGSCLNDSVDSIMTAKVIACVRGDNANDVLQKMTAKDPNDRYDEARGHVLPSLMSKFHRGVTTGEPVTVWGTGTATRDFLYSRDAAEALKTLLEQGDGVYNVASGNHVTIKQLVDELVAVSGFTGEVTWDRSKPDGQAARGYDITKLAALGWAPRTTMPAALAETWEWYLANADHVRH